MTAPALHIPERDYVSPGFSEISLDQHFPNMIAISDPDVLSKISLLETRKLCHRHYADQRFPRRGFVNRDEAHVLYNTALRYRDRLALEIGCWLGWSTCHLLSGGVMLDVIDPALEQEVAKQSVLGALNSAGLGPRVRLFAGRSPDLVGQIALHEDRKWSLFFIDGNHQVPGPIVDAFICSRSAEPDALILFHDLWQPAVLEALDYMQAEGWNTCVYNTFAIMGAAWRGDMSPVPHIPDPEAGWTIPADLAAHPVAPQTDG